ncbi:MAG: Arc family DNA-binding protein [Rhodobacteraceae bacterium]|nr:Arc family DNA-binding protein [Paracoccaceae bacterium]MBR9823032.1 Arc family DNA-binding protein [Paracoccaceae bacterium]
MNTNDTNSDGRLHLRLPDGWREALKVEAARNYRSMNGEIIFLLRPVMDEILKRQEGGEA